MKHKRPVLRCADFIHPKEEIMPLLRRLGDKVGVDFELFQVPADANGPRKHEQAVTLASEQGADIMIM